MTAATHLAVYDGREHMGSIVDRGANCKASDTAGKSLGIFKNRKLAVAAIEAKYRAKQRARDGG